MIPAVLVVVTLAALCGALLGYAALRMRVQRDPMVERIESLLPQTQCGQCGYPGCRPYAEAIAGGEADINQCPPGGEAGVRALAELLGREPMALDADRGVETHAGVVRIREPECIGCTKCIQACPVDAIVGAPRLMHTVIAELCTGCDLCLPVCPVDCIDRVEVAPDWRTARWPRPSYGAQCGPV
ncbi:MAG TPA: electron transport complex subunit RsxB [Xanthomonadaceae bacterium]|nr:electron transport complex subunit RsxB [Xanthomonadaceae bacterium]